MPSKPDRVQREPLSADSARTEFVIEIDDSRLAAARWGTGPVDVVLLHDGLGSIAQWRSVPGTVHRSTGATVLAYERAGHGDSTPIPDGAWPTDWLHREALVLDRLLDELAVDRPIIVGHSDGGSIALIHGANAGNRVRGVLAIAAHTWVEDICFESIVDMRADRDRFESGLARFHAAPANIFEAWSGVWVSDAFRGWDIRPLIAGIEAPTLIAQGALDAYATTDQATLTAAAVGANATCQIIDAVGHIAHHDDPEAIANLIAAFVRSIGKQ